MPSRICFVLVVALISGSPTVAVASLSRGAPVYAGTPVPEAAAQVQDTVTAGADTAESGDSLTLAEVSQERRAEDERIREELSATFGRIRGLSEVQLRAEAGVVTLSGMALSLEDRALADSLARGTPGVVYVDNRIEVTASIPARLGPARERVQGKLTDLVALLPLLLLAAVVVLIFAALARFISGWSGLYRRLTRDPFLQALFRQVLVGAVLLLGVLLALELLDATALVGAVLGAAGVLGVAVGFAFRNIAENYLAGIILSLRQPFSPNDHIVVSGQEGKVIRLTSRDTILMTLDGNHLRIPNAMIFGSVILNYTRNPLRRFSFEHSVSQDEDLARAQIIAVDTMVGMEQVLDDPAPRSLVVEMGDSWVLLRFFAWVDQARVALDKVRSEAIRQTKEALDREGVSMPAPEFGVSVLSGEAPDRETIRDLEAQARLGKATVERDATRPRPSAPPKDLGPDDALDEQIEVDRQRSGEVDLLRPPETAEGGS